MTRLRANANDIDCKNAWWPFVEMTMSTAAQSSDRAIRLAYQRYVTSVSHPAHAISLQLAFYLWELMEERQPRRVVDLGSGFSSYVFRLYATRRDPTMVVWSVDDDADWLQRTRRFLIEERLPTSGTVLWDAFNERGFDCVLHDLGTMDTRQATLSDALSLVHADGVAVLDDLHFVSYRKFVEMGLERHGFTHASVREKTLDMIGRFSWLALPATDS